MLKPNNKASLIFTFAIVSIISPSYNIESFSVIEKGLSKTARGAGGFGSTGK